ncbi:MAG: hypothetical protein JNK72_14100 [Myxococcales bacterium]|nr:hypothetical protein [Myxococcales bacterium]
MRTVCIALWVLLVGCQRTQPPAAAASGPPAPAPGGCENQSYSGPCTLVSVGEVSADGSPALAAADAANATFEARYRFDAPPGVTVTTRAVALGRARARVRAHFEAHRVARCNAVVLRAPCPPGTSGGVDVPPLPPEP